MEFVPPQCPTSSKANMISNKWGKILLSYQGESRIIPTKPYPNNLRFTEIKLFSQFWPTYNHGHGTGYMLDSLFFFQILELFRFQSFQLSYFSQVGPIKQLWFANFINQSSSVTANHLPKYVHYSMSDLPLLLFQLNIRFPPELGMQWHDWPVFQPSSIQST